jgi:hypothetical protein
MIGRFVTDWLAGVVYTQAFFKKEIGGYFPSPPNTILVPRREFPVMLLPSSLL